jgi:hypothetical protein
VDDLIYDRTQSDVDFALENPDSGLNLKGSYNYTDLNRVEGWISYLATTLTSYGYAVSVTSKTDWDMEDFPTKAEMKRIRDNAQLIRNAFTAFSELPDNLEKMTYTKANAIERVLYEINLLIKNMEYSFWHSDEIFAGEV